METKLQTFINSGLIEKYILGDTSITESMEVEHYISEYPEIENEYIRLQDNLEIIAKSNSVEAPKHILASVLEDLEEKPVINLNSSKNNTPWYSIAASFVAVAFCCYGIFIVSEEYGLN